MAKLIKTEFEKLIMKKFIEYLPHIIIFAILVYVVILYPDLSNLSIPAEVFAIFTINFAVILLPARNKINFNDIRNWSLLGMSAGMQV